MGLAGRENEGQGNDDRCVVRVTDLHVGIPGTILGYVGDHQGCGQLGNKGDISHDVRSHETKAHKTQTGELFRRAYLGPAGRRLASSQDTGKLTVSSYWLAGGG